MTSERPPDDAGPDALAPWLNGLAGRAGSGQAHEDGTRLRKALTTGAEDAPLASWRDIEARARAEASPDRAARPADQPPVAAMSRPRVAANEPRRWPAIGWAALLALAVGLVTWMSPPTPAPDEALRGAGSPQAPGARWLTEQPRQSAEALATELRGLGADVALTTDGAATILHIQAPPAAASAINARLSALETGLDADGRLRLSVAPLQ